MKQPTSNLLAGKSAGFVCFGWCFIALRLRLFVFACSCACLHLCVCLHLFALIQKRHAAVRKLLTQNTKTHKNAKTQNK
jgi:hypothetical protein